MNEEVGDSKDTSKESDIVYNFERDMERIKISMHAVINYVERVMKIEFQREKTERYCELIKKEFMKAEEIKRIKSAVYILKYGEIAHYYLFKPNEHGDHGNIFVINDIGVIKTIYRSRECGWYEGVLKSSKVSPRRRFKNADKFLKGTKRESVTKRKDKK